MLECFRRHDAPLALAVVPSWLTAARWREIQAQAGLGGRWCFHQHGRRHANHEPFGRKCEFGPARDLETKRRALLAGKNRLIVIDEAQDLTKAQMLVLSKIVSKDTNSLSIIADAAQRIYKNGFTWSEIGISVRGGRTIELKRNYRNTVKIMKVALSLLDHEEDKVEFTKVDAARKGDFVPVIGYFNNRSELNNYLKIILSEISEDSTISDTVLLHRNHAGLNYYDYAVRDLGYKTQLLNSAEQIDFTDESIKICTLSSVKGLEFTNVIVLDLNEGVVPYPEGFADEDDDLHISTERRLLYTAITRAKEKLFLLSSSTPSRYLDEIDKSLVNIIT